jgi:uncharacterized membrane protein
MKRIGVSMIWVSLLPALTGVMTGKEFHFFTAFLALLIGFALYKFKS